MKTDGQLDVILGLLGKLHLLRSQKTTRQEENDVARELVITGMSTVLNETRDALTITREERFRHIINALDSAIDLARKDDYYDAGLVLTQLAPDLPAISGRALRTLFPE